MSGFDPLSAYMERYGFIYIKGDASPNVWVYNQITGMKRLLSAAEGKILNAAKNADYTAKVTVPQALVDSLLEYKYTAGTTL